MAEKEKYNNDIMEVQMQSAIVVKTIEGVDNGQGSLHASVEDSLPIHEVENAAKDVLLAGQDYMVDLCKVVLKTADAFRSGQDNAGKEAFMEMLQGLEFFVTITNTLERVLGLDFEATFLAGKSLSVSVQELNSVLLEITKSQEMKDGVLLTDLLEYELVPQIELWRDIFIMLSQRGMDLVQARA